MKTHVMRAFTSLILVASISSPAGAEEKGWYRESATTGSQIIGSPLVVDLDSDGKAEVVVARLDDLLYAYNHDGTTYDPGGSGLWPVSLGLGNGTFSSPSYGDVDGDGVNEIVVVGNDEDLESAVLQVFETDGTLMDTYLTGTTASMKVTPCLIDCYRYDGTTRHDALEILLRDGDGEVHAVSWDDSSSEFVDLITSGGFSTCTSDSLRDWGGSQAITPSIAAANIGGDTTYLVVASTDNRIYRHLISSTSGTATQNWQVTALATVTGDPVTQPRFYSSPVLVDLDGDTDLDIITAGSDGEVHVWDADGTYYTGWEQPMVRSTISSPAVADITGDGKPNVIVASDDGAVYAWNTTGTLLSGFPVAALGSIIGSPTVAEVDGVPGLEIVAGSLDGYIYIWSADGTMAPGWPKRLNTTVHGAAPIADLHGWGRHSIVVPGYDGKVFVFDLAAKSLDVTDGWRQFRGGVARNGLVE